MNKDLGDVNLKKYLAGLSGFAKKESKHLAFGAMIFVLLIYIFIVFQINELATAEPSDDVQSSTVHVVKIDDKAIQQIQSLEKSNPQVQSLFNEARNNPFQE
jgi:hypothetical protein